MKLKLFNEFLTKFGVDYKLLDDEIKKMLNIYDSKHNISIFYYISKFDNLGHDKSDVDVYVYIDNFSKIKNSIPIDDLRIKILHKEINGLKFDIEVRESKSLIYFLNSFAKMSRTNFTMNENDLKLYLRIKNSLILTKTPLSCVVEKNHPKDKIESIIAEYYFLLAKEKYDDGKKLSKSNEFIISTECFREAVINMAGAVNSVHGNPNVKKKWIHKILLNLNNLDDSDIKDYYLNLIIYPHVTESTIIEYQQELINLYQMLNSEMSLNI